VAWSAQPPQGSRDERVCRVRRAYPSDARCADDGGHRRATAHAGNGFQRPGRGERSERVGSGDRSPSTVAISASIGDISIVRRGRTRYGTRHAERHRRLRHPRRRRRVCPALLRAGARRALRIRGSVSKRSEPAVGAARTGYECRSAVDDLHGIKAAIVSSGGMLIRFEDTEGNSVCAMRSLCGRPARRGPGRGRRRRARASSKPRRRGERAAGPALGRAQFLLPGPRRPYVVVRSAYAVERYR
jgi:hypothetical protein